MAFIQQPPACPVFALLIEQELDGLVQNVLSYLPNQTLYGFRAANQHFRQTVNRVLLERVLHDLPLTYHEASPLLEGRVSSSLELRAGRSDFVKSREAFADHASSQKETVYKEVERGTFQPLLIDEEVESLPTFPKPEVRDVILMNSSDYANFQARSVDENLFSWYSLHIGVAFKDGHPKAVHSFHTLAMFAGMNKKRLASLNSAAHHLLWNGYHVDQEATVKYTITKFDRTGLRNGSVCQGSCYATFTRKRQTSRNEDKSVPSELELVLESAEMWPRV